MTKSVYSLSYIVIQLLNCYIVYCSLRNTNYTNVRIKYCLLFNSHSVVIQWSFNCHSIVILFIVYCSLFIVLCLLFIVYCSLRNTNYTNVRIYNVFLCISMYFCFFIVLCLLFIDVSLITQHDKKRLFMVIHSHSIVIQLFVVLLFNCFIVFVHYT